MIVDFEKTSGALQGLKSSAGASALDELYGHLGHFRAKIGKNLNDGEFRYVMQTLFNEQVVTVPQAEAKNAEPLRRCSLMVSPSAQSAERPNRVHVSRSTRRVSAGPALRSRMDSMTHIQTRLPCERREKSVRLP